MKGVRRNAAINVAGNVVPMLAAVVAMPLLLNGLGAARMGIFTLALGLFGFAGIFDLGLGRALTRSVAHYSNLGTAPDRIAPLLRTGLVAVILMGSVWAVLLWAASGWLLSHVPGLAPDLRAESDIGLLILAALIPVALVSTSLLGALEGLQLFSRSNAIRIPIGVATFLVPALIAQAIPTLVAVMSALCTRASCRHAGAISRAATKIPLLAARGMDPLPTAPMWRYTGWLSVSNIVGPLMVYGDRYYLASLLAPAAVTTTGAIGHLVPCHIHPGRGFGCGVPSID